MLFLKIFFLMWTILKVIIKFVTVSFLFWFFGCKACGILASQSGIEPTPAASEGEVFTGLPGTSLKENILFKKKKKSGNLSQ